MKRSNEFPVEILSKNKYINIEAVDYCIRTSSLKANENVKNNCT